MPITLSGRVVSAAILVIEMEDVFEARMTSGLHNAVQVAENLRLDFKLLGRRLDNQIAIRELPAIKHRRDPAQRRGLVGGRDLVLRHFAIQILSDRLPVRDQETSAPHRTKPPEVRTRANTWAIPLPIVPAPITPNPFNGHDCLVPE